VGCSSSRHGQELRLHRALPAAASAEMASDAWSMFPYLCAWEVMILGDCVGVFVEPTLAIRCDGIVGKMREGQKSWFFGLTLLLKILEVHYW